jgi:hypothetical protein
MARRSDRKELDRILRRRGREQTAQVNPSVTEIRSCGVMGNPEPLPPGQGDLLGGLLIMWEYRVDYQHLQAFRDFIQGSEETIFVGIQNANIEARYLGTYMLHAGGTPCFRTMWAYTSQEFMTTFWATQLATPGREELVNLVKTLRSYWLRDPHRIEARWVPARRVHPDEHDYADAFTQITVDACELLG